MRAFFFILLAIGITANVNASRLKTSENHKLVAEQNLRRAIQLLDHGISKSFYGDDMRMADVYDVTDHRAKGTADVWPYTAVIESVNSVLEALESVKDIYPDIYVDNHERYVTLLGKLHDNLGYYKGNFSLHSYARIGNWSVYGVHRSGSIGGANVAGIENVYDDQEWLIRELLRTYNLTKDKKYLDEAENLAAYVIDGWDCYLDDNGDEYGGITWGPAYNSKHSCSNGPFISPLVWLYDIYKNDVHTTMVKRIITGNGTRKTEYPLKRDNYLDFAKKIYAWQKAKLLRNGVYADMLGADNTIQYVTVGNKKYRKHVDVGGATGTAFSYNTGTMLSGGADLYRVTGDASYLSDIRLLSRVSYFKFASAVTIGGKQYHEYVYRTRSNNEKTVYYWDGFDCWFHDVYMRGQQAVHDFFGGYSEKVLDEFQTNLDYAFDNYLKDGLLPVNLLGGWGAEIGGEWRNISEIRCMFQFTFASEYAMLVKYNMDVTGVKRLQENVGQVEHVNVYTVDGQQLRSNISKENSLSGLARGIYVVDGRKYVVR